MLSLLIESGKRGAKLQFIIIIIIFLSRFGDAFCWSKIHLGVSKPE